MSEALSTSHMDNHSHFDPASIDKSAKKTTQSPATPTPTQYIGKAETNGSWATPAGLPMRGPNDENLVIFRRAIGINYHVATSDGCTLEEGRKTAIGVYKAILLSQKKKIKQYQALSITVTLCYFAQIVLGAVLTALGPSSADYAVVITVLGASNTITAGLLALVKGQGLPERLRKDQMEYRKLPDWIEETEALLAVGVLGRNRKEVGYLVEIAFKKYNAARASEENNRPDSYVRQKEDDDDETSSSSSGNNMVSLSRGSRYGHV